MRLNPSHPVKSTKRPGVWVRLFASLCILAIVQLHLPSVWQDGELFQGAHAEAYVSNSMVVLVIGGKADKPKVDALERLLGRQLRRLEQVRAFDLSPVEGASAGPKAEKLVEEALRALLLRTPQRALERLKGAKLLLDKAPAAGNARLWARLFKALGLVALARSQLIPARDLLLKSLTLFPNQKASEYAAYGDQAKLLYDTVVKIRGSVAKGDLSIKTDVPRAEVWLDGVARGNTPLRLEDVPAGDHRLALRLNGYGAYRGFVRVTPGKPVVVSQKLTPAAFEDDLAAGRKVLTANFGQPSVVEDRIRELRNEIGTDQILVVRASFKRAETQMRGYILLADGTFKRVKGSIKRDAEYMDNAVAFLASVTGARVLPDPESKPLDERKSVVVATKNRKSAAEAYIDPNAKLFQDDKQVEEPLTKKWWFWAAVGGGVAVIGTVVGVLASGDAAGALGATGTVKINLNKTGK